MTAGTEITKLDGPDYTENNMKKKQRNLASSATKIERQFRRGGSGSNEQRTAQARLLSTSSVYKNRACS
jgi:hypothetical protein